MVSSPAKGLLKRKCLSFGHGEHFHFAAFHGFLEFFQGAFGKWVGVVMDGDDHLWLDPIARCKCSVFWIHGEVAPDGNQHQIRFVAFSDELHVTK